jgi:lysophospholipase L1-like esterase
MLPVIVNGDSLAVGMQAALEARLHPAAYNAHVGRTLAEGVAILRTRTLEGRIILISLGTNDLGRSAGYMASAVRTILKRKPACVVWGEIRVENQNGSATLNRGLRSVKDPRIRLVRAVRPDAGDGVHLTSASYERRAARFAQAARSCGEFRWSPA